MKQNIQTQFFLLIIVALAFASTAFAQNEDRAESRRDNFCSYYNYSDGNRASFKETREIKLAASNLIDVDAQRNGGISVKGEDRADVLVRACVQTIGATEQEARDAAKNVRIETGGLKIRAEGLSDEMRGAVSYEILVPRASNLKLKAYNGGISINSVEGSSEFETTNGGISIRNSAGSVKGKTMNGGLNVVLAGNSWRGEGLDIETRNGGVSLQLPETYQAHLETGTVNGGFRSSISGVSVPEDDYQTGRISKKRISTDLNGGGAPIRVITTNGGVQIGSVMTAVKFE